MKVNTVCALTTSGGCAFTGTTEMPTVSRLPTPTRSEAWHAISCPPFIPEKCSWKSF